MTQADIRKLKVAAGNGPVERRLGKSLRKEVLCPFHTESIPSFGAFTFPDGTPGFKCLGSCKWCGDSIKFVQQFDKLESRHKAVEVICAEVGISAPKYEKFKFDQKSACADVEKALAFPRLAGVSLKTAQRYGLGYLEHPALGPAVSIPYDDNRVKFRTLLSTSNRELKFLHLKDSHTSDQLYGINLLDWDWIDLMGEAVYVCESELDCLLLVDAGFNAVSISSATACVTGTGELNMTADHLAQLARAEMIFLAMDQDKPGQECAAAFEKILPRQKTYRLAWPYRGKQSADPKDIGELFQQSPETFHDHIQQLSEDARIPLLWRKACAFSELPEPNRQWVIEDVIPQDEVSMLTGDFGSGKSLISYLMASAISTGGNFVNHKCTQHKVLILDRENSLTTASDRCHRIADLAEQKDVRLLSLFTEIQAPELNDPLLLDVCAKIRPVVIVDSLIDFHPGKRENDADDMAAVFLTIRNLIAAGAVAVVILHHVPKHGDGRGGKYRGATSIPGAVCNAFHTEKKGNKLIISAFKCRDGAEMKMEIEVSWSPDEILYKVVESGKPNSPERRLANAIMGDPAASDRQLAKNAEISKNRVSLLAASIGYHRVDGVYVSKKPAQAARSGVSLASVPASLEFGVPIAVPERQGVGECEV